MNTSVFRAGFASSPLPAAPGMLLAGYGIPRLSTGVHDPIYVKAAVFSFHSRSLLLLSFDLLAVDHLLMEAVRSLLDLKELKFDQILFTAIHTHCAPGAQLDTEHGILRAARNFAGTPDRVLIEQSAAAAADAVEKACEQLRDASVKYSLFQAEGIASNRTDRTVREEGRGAVIEVICPPKKAVFCVFSCHPTVLQPDTLEISADFPGACAEILKEHGIDEFFFLNGAAGDLSCRYTRQSSTFEEVRRMGAILAQAILRSLKSMTELSPDSIGFAAEFIILRVRSALAADEASARAELWKAREQQALDSRADPITLREIRSGLEGANAELLFALNGPWPENLKTELSVLDLGSLRFVFVPGELFKSLESRWFDPETFVIGYANGYLLYFADRKAYENGVYEALSSPFEKGQAEYLMDRAAGALILAKKNRI